MKRKHWAKTPTFWATTWSVGFLSYAMWKQINLPWVTSVAPILAAAIVSYIVGNKAIDYRHGPEMRDDQHMEGGQ
jgi:hypothetical protein